MIQCFACNVFECLLWFAYKLIAYKKYIYVLLKMIKIL